MAFPNPAAARNQYLRTQVETASKEQLVVMLFDGIIRFTDQARKAIENKEIENSHNALMRAQAIVMELIVTIDKDKGGDVAKNLMALHAYSLNCLVQCNLRKDVAKIDEVQNIYRKLREGWVGAMESLGITQAAGKPAAPGAPAQAPAAKAPVAAPANGGRPVPPNGGKPLPTGMPQAPAAPVAGRPLAQPQQQPGGGVIAAKQGVPAMARPAAAQAPAAMAAKPAMPAPAAPAAAAKPAAPAAAPAPQAAPKPAMPAGGYGIGRTANLMSAYGAAAKPAVPPAAAKQNPGVGAYQQLGARNIA